jgi:hypothetical protein
MVPGQFPLLEPALLEQRLTDNSNNTRHESHSFWFIMCFALSLSFPHSYVYLLTIYLEDFTNNYYDAGPLQHFWEVREKIEGQQYTSVVPSSMGATFHKLGRKFKP